MEHQRLAAVGAVHQSREKIWLVHMLRRSLFVLANLLNNVPQLLRDQGLMS